MKPNVSIVLYSEFFFVLIYSMALKHIKQGMCVYVCMHVHVYAHTHTHTHMVPICILVYVHVKVHLC